MREFIPTKSYRPTNESLEIFQNVGRNFSVFQGNALVKKISRGKEFDIVYVVFGINNNKQRPIIVTENRARRQIIMLKRGQFAFFYGACFGKKYKYTYTNRKGVKNTKEVYQWDLYAYDINAHYVPKTYDFKVRKEEIENGEEQDYIDPMSEAETTTYEERVKGLLEKGLDKLGEEYIEDENEEEDEIR